MDYLLILTAALLRILPHPPNVTPVAAIALFGGAYLSRRFALLYPLCILFLSDLVLNSLLGLPFFLPESFFVYVSFLITGLLGLGCRFRRHLGVLYLVSLVSSVQFFILSNFGTWFVSGMYSKDAAGLLQCYTMAIPFFRNSVAGDLVWISFIVGAYHFSRRLLPVRTAA